MDTKFVNKAYVIMRSDLWDMNPGKGMAQSFHAGNDMAAKFALSFSELDSSISMVYQDAFLDWVEDRTFGTAITLGAPLEYMQTVARACNTTKVETPYGMIVDTSYPYRNYYGETFFREEITCMWVFVTEFTDSGVTDLIAPLQLHR